MKRRGSDSGIVYVERRNARALVEDDDDCFSCTGKTLKWTWNTGWRCAAASLMIIMVIVSVVGLVLLYGWFQSPSLKRSWWTPLIPIAVILIVGLILTLCGSCVFLMCCGRKKRPQTIKLQ